MKVVVYRNSKTENGVEYSLIYDGIASITDTTTARDVFDPLGIEVPLHVHLCFKNDQFNGKYVPEIWMSYYFDDGVLRTNFDPVDAKISELNNYGYEFDHLEFLVDTLGGIGAGGALDFLKQFYDAANEICKQYGIENYTINENLTVDINGDFIFNHIVTKLPIKLKRYLIIAKIIAKAFPIVTVRQLLKTKLSQDILKAKLFI